MTDTPAPFDLITSPAAWVAPHLRELIEQGFEVAVVKDATAAPKHPTWGYGYTAALINYQYLAHAVLRADEVVLKMKG